MKKIISHESNNISISKWAMKLFMIFNLFYLSFIIASCKKLIEIPAQVGNVTANEVFSSETQAISAVSGVYYDMINTSLPNFSSGSLSIYSGMSADELKAFIQSIAYSDFQNNRLLSTNGFIQSAFWNSAYYTIYKTNAIMEGIGSASAIRDSVKQEMYGELKFIRAFCNFYLINLFGDIPLVNSTDWHNTGKLMRANVSDVYSSIIADLEDAQSVLQSNYAAGKGQKIIPNKSAATALLARVYLYLKNWSNAEALATNIINLGIYSLNSNLNDIFKPNSSEAIWQLQQSQNMPDTKNATVEGYQIIPADAFSFPYFYLTTDLLNSFESGDKRKTSWVDSTKYSNVIYYYPKKYKIGSTQAVLNGAYSEYYMILRFAEQYLIRAEARAQQNDLLGAVADINVIRVRAGLAPLPTNALTQVQVMAAIEQENRIEFFVEWGHRWLDLKRWARADAVLGPVKASNWQTPDQLYPIPQSELITDPNLTQNPGY